MSETSNDTTPATEEDLAAERAKIAEVDEELDAQSDGEGLGNEAGRAEENGIGQG